MPRSDRKWRKMSDKEKSLKLKELGQEAYERKEYDAAISHYSNASNLSPKEMTVIYQIGKIHLEQKNYAESIKFLTKAYKIGKEQQKNVKMMAKAMALRGRAHKELGKTDKFEEDIARALKYLKNVAQAKFDKEMWDECIEFCQSAYEMGKENDFVDEEILVLKSKATTRMNEATRAEDLKKQGNDAYNKKDFDAALKHYLEAKKLNPREITYLNNMAAVKLEQNKYDECIKFCDEAINIGKKNRADSEKMEKARDRRRRAQKFLQAEAEITEKLQNDLKMGKDNVDVVAEAERWQSTEEQAKRLLMEEHGLSKADIRVHHASEKVQKVVQAAEDACNMGDEAYNKRDFDTALKHYLKAKKLSPKEITYLNNIATVKLEQKKYDQCMEVCDEAVNIGKKNMANLKKIAKALDTRVIAQKFFADQMEKQLRMANKDDAKLQSEESKEFRQLLKLFGLDKQLNRVSAEEVERQAKSKLLKAAENTMGSEAVKLPEVFESPAKFCEGILQYLKANDLSPLYPRILHDVSKALSEKKNFKGCCTLINNTFDQLPEWTDER